MPGREEHSQAQFVRLFAAEYFKSGLTQPSVDALINHGIFRGNLKNISNEQILALPGFNPDDLPKLDSIRTR